MSPFLLPHRALTHILCSNEVLNRSPFKTPHLLPCFRRPRLSLALYIPAPSPLNNMSEYIKSKLATVPQRLRSLQSFSSYRLNVPRMQLPTPSLQGQNNLPARTPRAFIAFAFILFLLFWKDIIRDVCSHIAIRRPPVPVINVSPIRNDTLGVCLLEISFCYCRWLTTMLVSIHFCPCTTRTRRPKSTPPRRCKCHQSHSHRT